MVEMSYRFLSCPTKSCLWIVSTAETKWNVEAMDALLQEHLMQNQNHRVEPCEHPHKLVMTITLNTTAVSCKDCGEILDV